MAALELSSKLLLSLPPFARETCGVIEGKCLEMAYNMNAGVAVLIFTQTEQGIYFVLGLEMPKYVKNSKYYILSLFLKFTMMVLQLKLLYQHKP